MELLLRDNFWWKFLELMQNKYASWGFNNGRSSHVLNFVQVILTAVV